MRGEIKMFEYFLLLSKTKKNEGKKNHKQLEMNIMRTDQKTFNKFMWKAQKRRKMEKSHKKVVTVKKKQLFDDFSLLKRGKWDLPL